jgi:hypothetical protein
MSLPRTRTRAEFGAELARFEALVRSVVRTDRNGGAPPCRDATRV